MNIIFKINKKSFTLIEMIISTIILVIISGTAFLFLGDTNKHSINNLLLGDANSAISTEETFYSSKNFYDTIKCTSDGSICKGDNGAKFHIHKNNTITIDKINCDNETEGYLIKVSNSNTNKEATFNSCIDIIPSLK